MHLPEYLATGRLILRRPLPTDAEAIFTRYASDPEVTRYLGWSRHTSLEQTRAFLAFSDAAWQQWPGGPYIVESRATRALLGGAGFAFEAPDRAEVGYVFAQDAWGCGYSTETLQALIVVSENVGMLNLHARCHPDHQASVRVLEKCGFTLEGRLRRPSAFPNLGGTQPMDVLCYTRTLRRMPV